LLLAGAGYYAYQHNAGKSPLRQQTDGNADKSSTPANKAFKGGDQGFVSLLLDKVEDINHNTKRFRFKLPDENDVSGLQVACE
jgi:cytochrome-b5 reductase